MKTVMTFGTFDIIHPGHLFYLRQARKYGRVVTVIARDITVKKIKSKKPKNDEKKRLKKLKSLGIVHGVILGDKKDYFKVIRKIKPDIICLGYDQNPFEIKFKGKIVRIRPYKKHQYKTSILREN